VHLRAGNSDALEDLFELLRPPSPPIRQPLTSAYAETAGGDFMIV